MSEPILIYGMNIRKRADVTLTPMQRQFLSTYTLPNIGRKIELGMGHNVTNYARNYYKTKMRNAPSDAYVSGNGHSMKVSLTTKEGIKHLYHDTLAYRSAIHKEDLPNMKSILENAEFVAKMGLYKPRKDKIKRFYYFKTKLHGNTIYLHVAEEDTYDRKGGAHHKRYLYSATRNLKIRKRR